MKKKDWVPINFRMPKELYEKLVKYETGNLSYLIRRIIEEYLDKQ